MEEERIPEEEELESDEEEDMEDDTAQVEMETRLKAVNASLESNPYDYQSHVDKISLLSSLGELEDLRSAREAFSKLYPLSVDLWLSWLSDEQKLASTPKERKEVSHLFKKAVVDYLSVDIWIEYCSFILGDVGSGPEGVCSVREVFEEAVSAVGLHLEKGHLVWGAYRDFEVAVMNLHSRGYEYVFKVFQRQLAIPLLNMDKTIEELKDFEDIPGFKRLSSASPLEPLYQTSLKKLQDREAFENALLQSKDDSELHFSKYSEYIGAMRDSKPMRLSPPELQNLFERRITDHCLNPTSWSEYLAYLDSELKIQSISIPVYRRALRNCPWHGQLWIKYMRALERFGSEHKEITGVFEEALASGFSDPGDYSRVWVEYIGYFRRRMDDDDNESGAEKGKKDLKNLFERSLCHLEAIPNSDPEMRLHRLWASFSGDRLRDMETSRKIWAQVLNGLGGQMIYWTEYVALEKLFGDGKHLRKVFLRGMEKIRDCPEYFGELWRQFELEEGDLGSLDNAEEKIKKCLAVNQERLSKEAEELKRTQSKKWDKRKDKKAPQERGNARKRKMESQDESPKKAKREDDVFKAPFPSTKKQKEESISPKEEGVTKPPPGYKGDKQVSAPPPGYKGDKQISAPPGYKGDKQQVSAPPGYKGDKQQVSAPPGFSSRPKSSIDAPPPETATPSEDKTVFLSNLSFEVTEEEIRVAMEKTGPVKEVRLAKSYNGKSRGFAYVEFCESQSVSGALLRDNEILKGRPLYISECNANKEGHTFKYSTRLEKNKLFLRGLHPSSTKEDIHKLFSTHGNVTEVRVVSYRNGKSKGIAYVDFEKEADASQALLKIDGSEFMGRSVNVAFSNPPEKKKAEPELPPSSCLGGGVVRKQQQPFIPRSLTAASSSSNGGGAPKSNADFRNLLLKK